MDAAVYLSRKKMTTAWNPATNRNDKKVRETSIPCKEWTFVGAMDITKRRRVIRNANMMIWQSWFLGTKTSMYRPKIWLIMSMRRKILIVNRILSTSNWKAKTRLDWLCDASILWMKLQIVDEVSATFLFWSACKACKVKWPQRRTSWR